MADPMAFPVNKRYAMIFQCESPTDELFTTEFLEPKTGQLSPSNVSIASFRTPETLDEALELPRSPTKTEMHRAKHVTQARQSVTRVPSTECYLEVNQAPPTTPKKEPKSRKINSTVIYTDATDTQPSFESDAFAVEMPTTREPVIESPVYRDKLPSPSRAQVEAYRTYREKAQQVRERINSQGVRGPSKFLSYDYACTQHPNQPKTVELEVSPPESPNTPAGSFPDSPPTPQEESWSDLKHSSPILLVPRGPRAMSDSNHITIARKPIATRNATTTATTTRSRYQREFDTLALRSTQSSPSPSPIGTPKIIKVRLRPRVQDVERVQKESWWGLYNRTPPASSGENSRAASPVKAMPNIANSNPSSGDSIFGYPSQDITGTLAGASCPASKEKSNEKAKAPPKKPSTKRSQTSRWAWLRPTGPRITKPTSQSKISPTATAARASTYIDPFLLHSSPIATKPSTPAPSTPTESSPASPKKAVRVVPAEFFPPPTPPPTHPLPAPPSSKTKTLPPLQLLHKPTSSRNSTSTMTTNSTHIPPSKSKGKFETGFAQISSLTSLIVRFCFLIYALVGLYFVLDAVREVVYILGTPIRFVRMLFLWLWLGVEYVGVCLCKAWERYGVEVVGRGVWRWRG